jgi:tRNA dimethylallyltransferase
MIYAIIGPTGVGKTKLSIMLAKKLNAEIINCDSQQVYKELSIGVAKIKDEEKEGIVHHLIDNVSVLDNYSVFEYQKESRKILNKLLSEGKNVVIVGGTGLYLKALLYDYTFDNKDNKNKKLYDFKLIGLTRNRTHLYEIINDRVDLMINLGLENEVRNLYDKNINSKVVNTAIGYKEFYSYFKGEITKEEAISLIKKRSRNYAKRQYTFFNNQFNDILWYDVDKVSLLEVINTII